MLVSIQLMSPASGDYEWLTPLTAIERAPLGFHSINVPSEWGPISQIGYMRKSATTVSIQLMSPASGDCGVQ